MMIETYIALLLLVLLVPYALVTHGNRKYVARRNEIRRQDRADS